MADAVSLEFIGRQLLELHGEMRAMRTEQRDTRTITLSLVDALRRLRDDLELMIRSESMSRAAHFETVFERKLDDLREKVEALAQVDH